MFVGLLRWLALLVKIVLILQTIDFLLNVVLKMSVDIALLANTDRSTKIHV